MEPRPCIVVGCGPRALGHARAIARSPYFDLVACHDVDGAAAEAFARRHGICSLPGLDRLPGQAGGVLAVLATPPAVRAEPVRALLDAGASALLVEKPLATTWGAVEEVVAAAAGVPLFVNQQLRFMRPSAPLAAAVREGALGRVTAVHAASRASWSEHGPHLLDLVGGLGGFALDWQRVQAWDAAPARGPGLDGVGDVVARVGLGAGLPLVLQCGPSAPRWPGRDEPWHQMGLEILGTGGRVSFSLNRGWTLWTSEGRVAGEYHHDGEDDASQVRLLADVRAALTHGRPSPAGLAAQWPSLTLQHAVAAAAARGAAFQRDEMPAEPPAVVPQR